jgi:pimeloyl-ACP methyl ester carboxylesterase
LLGTCPRLDDELDRLAALAGGPTWWIGHSLGGIVALQLAARQPQVVAGLVLLAANARAAAPAVHRRRAAHWPVAQREGLRTLVTQHLVAGYDLPHDDALAESLVGQAERVGLQRYAHQLAYACERRPLNGQGPWISLPVLALSAAHDALCPPAHSDEIVALATPGTPARHGMQHPAWVAHGFADFLRRHAGDGASR